MDTEQTSERKKPYEALEALMENTSLGIAVMDTNHRIIHVNATFARLFKRTVESFVGLPCYHEFEKRDAICPHCPGIPAMETGRMAEVETEGVLDDGSRFNARNRAVPYFGPDKKLAGFIEMVEDFTEKKRAEDQLKQERNFSQSIIETAQAIMLVLDSEGKIVSFNPYMEELSGYCLEEVKGQDWFSLFLPSRSRDPIRHLFEKAIGGTQTHGAINPIVAKDGRLIDIEWYDKTLTDNDGNVTGLLSIGQDVTERIQKEKELRDLHVQLIAASRRAGMAEVATDILHNVGNILNSINISLGGIKETTSNSKAQGLRRVADIVEEHLDDLGDFITRDERGMKIPLYLSEAARCIDAEREEVTREVDFLTKSINHIKEIVRTQQVYAKSGGVRVSMDIRDVIRDAVEICRQALERHHVNVHLDLADLPEICSDRQRILQILVNFINNAKQAMVENHDREKHLTLRCYPKDEERLCMEVTDNGIGIPGEHLTKIFTRGFTTREDGHGFGLHSGALVAKELGGTLSVHSDGPGRGATFVLEIPFLAEKVLQ
ncbi:MAG: PAS domain S-box protein [Phycisphaerae bacterium]|nr:PAS domain S-box protein [Phycisphaerae bacterium]